MHGAAREIAMGLGVWLESIGVWLESIGVWLESIGVEYRGGTT